MELTTAFTSSYLANIASNLTGKILSGVVRSLRQVLGSTETKQALERCVYAGTLASVAKAYPGTREKELLLAEILERFFKEEDTGRELANILSGMPLNHRELSLMFTDAGYDPNTLPGIRFDEAMDSFHAGFIAAAICEPLLQPIIQANQLLEQTRIQRDLLNTMKGLAEWLKNENHKAIGIQAGVIIAQNVVNGEMIEYRPEKTVSDTADTWEAFYLKRLIIKCDPLDLAAVDESCLLDSSDARGIRVSDVFITLYLKDLSRVPDQSVSDVIINHRKPEFEKDNLLKKMEHTDREKQIPIQATEAAASVDRLVILGQPGGGKSTLVNHLAAVLARSRMGDADAKAIPGWNEGEKPIPVRIVLRQFADNIKEGQRKGAERLVWDYLEIQLREWGCPEFYPALKKILNDEGGVVFFDGLDEIPETDEEMKRSVILNAIRDFAKPLNRCRIIITCREYAWRRKETKGKSAENSWRRLEKDFSVVELDLFQKEQMESFIHTWYRVTGPHKGWSAARCSNEAGHLVQAVQSMHHLQELAHSPLLLTLMAIVHSSKGLPEDRADLYDRAVELLLAHWENRIVRDEDDVCRIEPSIIIKLNLRVHQLRVPLERIALSAHERQEKDSDNRIGCADIPIADVREELATELEDWNQANQVIEYIENRSGLLQAKDNRTFTFPHRTFQEYLAATGIMRKSDFDSFLSERIFRDIAWWQEVFLLAAGSSRDKPKLIYDMVDALLPNDSSVTELTSEIVGYARLSAQAMGETDFIKHVNSDSPQGKFVKICKRVQDCLLTAMKASSILTPKERCDSGTALNWIGDFRFNPKNWYLPNDDNIGFVKIPAGKFLMGSDKKRDKNAYDEELPQHTVELPEYWIAKYPVTVAQFRVFFEDSGYQIDNADWEKDNRYDNHPVVQVSWYDAQAYCKWLTEKFKEKGWQFRLPTEAEWEKASRGTDGHIYPWGDEKIVPNLANYNDTGIGNTCPVGCFPGGVSRYDILDMIGNVWEWTHSVWGKNYGEPDFKYPYDPNDGREDESSGSPRVLRGGSWGNNARGCRSADRRYAHPGDRGSALGFRVQRFSP